MPIAWPTDARISGNLPEVPSDPPVAQQKKGIPLVLLGIMNDHEARFWCAKLYIVSAISRTATHTTQEFHTRRPPITQYVTKFKTTTPYTPALNA